MTALSEHAAFFAASQSAPDQGIGVYDLFRDHLHVFARLPGEVSNFEQFGSGYQWHCEFELGDGTTPGDIRQPMSLHFFLVDTGNQSRPVASLYLVAGFASESAPGLLVNLKDLGKTLDDLNRHLAEQGGILEMSIRANQFVEELAGVKEELGTEVIWQ